MSESIVQEEDPESIEQRRSERTANKLAREIAAVPAPPAVERLAPDDLAELRGLAQAYEQQQQQAAQAQEAATKALGALEYVGQRLHAKYGLGERDGMQPDGTIVRAPRGE